MSAPRTALLDFASARGPRAKYVHNRLSRWKDGAVPALAGGPVPRCSRWAAPPAAAHVTVHSAEAVQGAYAEVAFRVSTESATVSTVNPV
jgi:hypothetical protein